MDPRSLLSLAPSFLRGPLAALLDRLEALEKRVAELERRES